MTRLCEYHQLHTRGFRSKYTTENRHLFLARCCKQQETRKPRRRRSYCRAFITLTLAARDSAGQPLARITCLHPMRICTTPQYTESCEMSSTLDDVQRKRLDSTPHPAMASRTRQKRCKQTRRRSVARVTRPCFSMTIMLFFRIT